MQLRSGIPENRGRSMKALIIVGAKKNGNTDKLVRQFAKGAASAGHEVEIEYLFKKSMRGCIHCQSCKRNGGACVWNDGVPEMLDKLLAADVLVLASPVYYFALSSQLKMFMDRTYAIIEKIRGKRFFFISTADGPSDVCAAGFEKVLAPIEGWTMCFAGTTFEKSIAHWDMSTTDDITKSAAYAEAEDAGGALSSDVAAEGVR